MQMGATSTIDDLDRAIEVIGLLPDELQQITVNSAGVTAVAIAPGSTRTPMLAATADLYDTTPDELASHQGIRRLIEPEEIAQTIALCCSPPAPPSTGPSSEPTAAFADDSLAVTLANGLPGSLAGAADPTDVQGVAGRQYSGVRGPSCLAAPVSTHSARVLRPVRSSIFRPASCIRW